jgi:hypothetical protein
MVSTTRLFRRDNFVGDVCHHVDQVALFPLDPGRFVPAACDCIAFFPVLFAYVVASYSNFWKMDGGTSG